MRFGKWSWISNGLLKLCLALGIGLSATGAALAHGAHPTPVPTEHTSMHAQAHSQAQAHTPPALAHSGHAGGSRDACPEHAVPPNAEPHGHHHCDGGHCTAHADCHHCCPLVWGHGLGLAGQAAPHIRPQGPMTDGHSASWGPDLRPPIA